MSQKIRIRTKLEVDGFYFPSMSGLVWHSDNFWLHQNKLKYVYNNGSKSILIGGTKHGLRKFRKEAKPCKITILDELPF